MINRRVVTQGDFLRLDRTHWMMKGLIGWWPLQDGAGLSVFDWSGLGNVGTLTNMDPDNDWVTGHRGGYSLNFDGITDHIPVDPPVNSSTGTLSAWLRRERNTGNDQYSVCGRTNLGSRLYLAYWDSSAGYYLCGLGSSAALSTGAETGGLNEWHHVCLTWNNGNYEWYFNGVSKVSGSYSGSPNPQDLAIGAVNRSGSPVSNLFWDGDVQDVRIWDTGLNAVQIQQLYINPWAPLSTKSKTFLTASAPGIIYNQRQILIRNQRLILK